jgi:hypothetical protein
MTGYSACLPARINHGDALDAEVGAQSESRVQQDVWQSVFLDQCC